MNYKNKLFTLVEVMAVMTIIVIMLSIGVSGYRNITSQTSLQIQGLDLVSQIKSSVSSSIRSKTPTLFNIQMGKTLSEKSYMLGGKNTLRFAFDFDSRDKDENWTPHVGLSGVQIEMNESSSIYTDAFDILKEFTYSSSLGMCGDLRGTDKGFELVNEIYLSSDVFGAYAECKIKLEPLAQALGAGTLINLGNDNSLLVNSDGYLLSNVNGTNYPDTTTEDEYLTKVDTGNWIQVGMMIVKVVNDSKTFYVLQFVDGQLVYKDLITLNNLSFNGGGYPSFGEQFNGLIDDIKVYDVLQGDLFVADPKAGFLVSSNGNVNSITSVVVDGEGKLVQLADTNTHGVNWTSDFIGLASSSVYGVPTYRNTSNNLVNTNLNSTTTVNGIKVNRWRTSGSRLSLAESGYLLLHHKNITTITSGYNSRFELVRYKDYDGDEMLVTGRGLGGTKQMNGTSNFNSTQYTIRAVFPVILNKFGAISR